VIKYFFIDEGTPGRGTSIFSALLSYLTTSISVVRVSVKWMPFLKNKRADPDARATRFFVEKFGFCDGRDENIYDYLTKNYAVAKKKKTTSSSSACALKGTIIANK
jgi:hypothetical protein